MDPDECLDRIRQIVNLADDGDISVYIDELVDAFQGLDEWLSMGGFLPNDWKTANKGG